MIPALYLIPMTLGDSAVDRVFPPYNREVVLGIRHFIVEEVRTARRFLKLVDKSIDINALTFYEMGKHADSRLFATYLAPLRAGEPMGVISEAGCPAVADPGAIFVALAQGEGLRVVPLVGPSSILLALMASGLNGQSFAFNGYLPVDADAKARTLKHLETRAIREGQTQMFIEAPYRNNGLIKLMLQTLAGSTRLCIAAGITCEDESIRTHTVAQWRKAELPDLNRTPAIFAIGK